LKSTGIVRRVDELGRVVLPIELRRTLDIEIRNPLEIYVEGDMVILKKYEPACIFCGEAKEVVDFKGKIICSSCARELAAEAPEKKLRKFDG
jgi:transcriptional pleiotropic regulator of transition state genes